MDMTIYPRVLTLLCVWSVFVVCRAKGGTCNNNVISVNPALLQNKLIDVSAHGNDKLLELKASNIQRCLQMCVNAAQCTHVNLTPSTERCRLYYLTTPTPSFHGTPGDWYYAPVGALTAPVVDGCSSMDCGPGKLCVVSYSNGVQEGVCASYVTS